MSDQVETVRALIEDNWNASNSDSITPTVIKVYDRISVDASDTDFVLVYQLNYASKNAAVGTAIKSTTDSVAVEVRCGSYPRRTGTNATSRAHFIKVRDELERVIDSQVISVSDYDFIELDSGLDRSDKRKNLWVWTNTVRLVNLTKQRGS